MRNLTFRIDCIAILNLLKGSWRREPSRALHVFSPPIAEESRARQLSDDSHARAGALNPLARAGKETNSRGSPRELGGKFSCSFKPQTARDRRALGEKREPAYSYIRREQWKRKIKFKDGWKVVEKRAPRVPLFCHGLAQWLLSLSLSCSLAFSLCLCTPRRLRKSYNSPHCRTKIMRAGH